MKSIPLALTALAAAGSLVAHAESNPMLDLVTSGQGIRQASQDEIDHILNNVNKSSEFVATIECEFVPKHGVTLGHTADANGKYQRLDIEPTMAPLKIQVGQWTNGGELEGQADVKMSWYDKSVRQQDWPLSGHEAPAGHPAMVVTWSALQTVDGRRQLLQEHQLMIAMNYSPTAPAYYTQTQPMKAGDEAGKRTMAVTVVPGSCSFSK
jgi:hypothetical protein